jgi:aspartyl aminopeptidase
MSAHPHFDRTHTDDLAAFLSASPSQYHAVASAAERLEKAGFRQVSETDAWDGEAGGRYVLRGGAIIGWYVPVGARPETPFRIVGAHTDSTNLRVKPVPDTSSYGWRQLAVEIYGGALLNTWLDRDLGLSGRIVLRDGGTALVNLNRPLLRVPQLAVHLDRGVNEGGLKLDKQRHMQPVWGLGELDEGALVRIVAEEAGVDPAQVVGWDLMMHDVQPPAYLGLDGEFLAAGRLDNLLSVHAGTAALASAARADLPYIPVLAAFDHEENGSESDTGAGGPLLGNVLERSVFARGGSYDHRARAFAGTVCVSADTGHAVHPNYAEKHDPTHRPLPNGGPILKVNVNQRYATDGTGRGIFAAACDRAGVPWQTFVSNNAMPCGTTIGPITAARHGITTVDVGVPILSMHSARELCGVADPYLLASALKAFLEG